MAIAWNDSMSTSVDEIDEQHKELISMVNALSEAMRSGKGKDETAEPSLAQPHMDVLFENRPIIA